MTNRNEEMFQFAERKRIEWAQSRPGLFSDQAPMEVANAIYAALRVNGMDEEAALAETRKQTNVVKCDAYKADSGDLDDLILFYLS